MDSLLIIPKFTFINNDQFHHIALNEIVVQNNCHLRRAPVKMSDISLPAHVWFFSPPITASESGNNIYLETQLNLRKHEESFDIPTYNHSLAHAENGHLDFVVLLLAFFSDTVANEIERMLQNIKHNNIETMQNFLNNNLESSQSLFCMRWVCYASLSSWIEQMLSLIYLSILIWQWIHYTEINIHYLKLLKSQV